MTRNFHRWEVDPFFCAAEEVQDSADRLESVYRTWLHVKSHRDDVPTTEFHRRELSTALGTAKWQLEEFERAVSSVIVDDRIQGGDDAPSRHKQFVDALQNQINTIEIALSSLEDCRDFNTHQAFSLGEKEKDDLELFLCGSRSNMEDNIGNFTSLQVGKLDEIIPCSGLPLPLDVKDGALSHISMPAVNADVKYLPSTLNKCLWRHDISCADKLETDHNETEMRSFSGRRIDEISKPVSDPIEHLHSDRGEPFAGRVDDHHRSVSLSSGLNAWKSGSITDGKKKRQRLISVEVPSRRLNFQTVLAKLGYTRNFKSGLKRWKDGDADARDHEMLALMHDADNIEQGNGTACLGTKKVFLNGIEISDHSSGDIKHHTTVHDNMQSWRSAHYGLPFVRLVHVASAILVALGLVGLLSFHVSSSSL